MSNFRNNNPDRLATMFKALSNPQRLRIFLKLAGCCSPLRGCEPTSEGMRRCIGDLGADLGLAASTVSYHIKELRIAGLLHVERRGQKIECWTTEDILGLLASFFDSVGGKAAVGDAGESGVGRDDGAQKQ